MILSGRSKIAGVMGWPVEHSLSPRLHGYWLEEYGIDGAYVPLAVAPENLAEALRALPKLGFQGCNLTLPHKEQALVVVDELSEQARIIGAVNTIAVRDGALYGTNTDAFGFIENIREQGRMPRSKTKAVILGAGGAARAVAYGLAEEGFETLTLLNRTRERAEGLAADFSQYPIEVVDWEKRDVALEGADLLVNTTTLGMKNHPAPDLALDALPKTALVTDIVYCPLKTNLLEDAQKRGNPTVDGLGMLLHQAASGFEMWFGKKPQVSEKLRQFVLAP